MLFRSDHLSPGRDLHHRAGVLPCHRLAHHRRDACAGACRCARRGAREGALMFWDWSYTWEIVPILAEASIVTIEATVLGFILAATVGLLLAILRMSPRPWISLPADGFVELVRSTPPRLEAHKSELQ